MDERLSYWRGARVGHLRRTDLPPVALAIVAHIERRALAWRMEVEDQEMIRIYRDDGQISVFIRGEDWAKIAPYVRDGFWNPVVAPPGPPEVFEGSWAADVATLDQTCRRLYDRVLGVLLRLFPDDYPTTTI